MNVYWLEQIEADVPAENDWLSENEAVCLNAMRFAKRRADWRLGRWTAKRALSAYLDVPAGPQSFKQMNIRPAPDGAPEVFFGDLEASIAISLSHRAGIAICAVAASGVEIGCDLEIVEPHSDAFIADYFTAEEQQRVAQAPADDRNRLLTLLWSAKESALKALRTGLRLDTRSVIVNPFVPAFDLNGWSPLSVRYAGDCSQKDRDNEGRDWEDQVFHGWWHDADNIVRTAVAAPSPDSPIPLKIPGYAFNSAYEVAETFA